MKILVPADGSEFTKRMLAYLAAHDEWLGARHQYTVLHVTPAVPPRAAAALDKALLDQHYADESEKVLKPIRAFFSQQGIQASFVNKVGHAAETITTMADKDAFDLVMLGSHGHGSLANLVLGSVATKVLAGCGVPVLMIR